MTQGSLPPRHTLTVREYAALEPFYKAQRPHDDVLSWRELRAAGHKPVPKQDPSLKEVCDRFNIVYHANLDFSKTTRKTNDQPTGSGVC